MIMFIVPGFTGSVEEPATDVKFQTSLIDLHCLCLELYSCICMFTMICKIYVQMKSRYCLYIHDTLCVLVQGSGRKSAQSLLVLKSAAGLYVDLSALNKLDAAEE